MELNLQIDGTEISRRHVWHLQISAEAPLEEEFFQNLEW
jgi:hypothetical protein